jgi:hypothetical protein
MTTNAKFEEQAQRIAYDPIYGAGFRHGYDGHSGRRHYAFPLDRLAWADGLRDGTAESRHKSKAITDWMSRSQPPRR